MAIMPKIQAGQLVETTIGAERYVGLVKSSMPALRRGLPPMVLVQWCGRCPRDYAEEHVEESLLRIIK